MLVFYETTQACDLVCRHCRACAQPEPHCGELSPADSERLLLQLAEFPKKPTLIFTGGDPLKRPDLCDMITQAADLGLNPAVTPSATPLVTLEAVAAMKQAGAGRLAISLDGADAATHDVIRGVPGSFERVLEILKAAREVGLSTQVNSTISPSNVEQLEAIADLLESLQIDLWSAFFIVPVGRALDAERLDGEACEAAFARLWKQAQRRPFVVKTTEAMHYRRYVIQHQLPKRAGRDRPPAFTPIGLNDGRGIMFVGHTGVIYPSGFLPIVCGVFPFDHVTHVYQQSPIFRLLRDADRLSGKCGRCEFRRICGGSRARAFAITGNLMASEPDCIYQPTTAAPY